MPAPDGPQFRSPRGSSYGEPKPHQEQLRDLSFALRDHGMGWSEFAGNVAKHPAFKGNTRAERIGRIHSLWKANPDILGSMVADFRSKKGK